MSFELSIKLINDREDLHTTPHNLQGVRWGHENGQGKWHIEVITPMYPEEYLWRERYSRDEPAAFNYVLSHNAGIYMER